MKISVTFNFDYDPKSLAISDSKVYLGKLQDMTPRMPWLAYLCKTSTETTVQAFYDPAPHLTVVVYCFTITKKQETFYNLNYGSY